MQAMPSAEPDRDGGILRRSLHSRAVLFADRQSVPPQFRVVRQLHKNAYEQIFSALAEKFAVADRDRRPDLNYASARYFACAVLRH